MRTATGDRSSLREPNASVNTTEGHVSYSQTGIAAMPGRAPTYNDRGRNSTESADSQTGTADRSGTEGEGTDEASYEIRPYTAPLTEGEIRGLIKVRIFILYF